MMKLQVWSDVMCPFCYLGIENLKNAIKEYDGNESFEVEFKAFQLNPSQEKSIRPDNPISYSIKKGIDEQRVKSSFQYIIQEANSLNLPIDIENAKVVNSLDALRLIKYANKYNKSEAIKYDLFKAYFADGIDVSEIQNLLDIARNNGLNISEVSDFLNTNQLVSDVNNDINEGI